MRLRVVATACAAACLFASVADARSVRRLAPSGKWIVDYATDTCRLGRQFGEGRQQLTMILEQRQPSDVFYTTLIGRAFDPAGVGRKATLQFGPNEQPDPENIVRTATIGEAPAVILGQFQTLGRLPQADRDAAKTAEKRGAPRPYPAVSSEREKAATWLSVSRILPFDLLLETGPMDKPFAALRANAPGTPFARGDCRWTSRTASPESRLRRPHRQLG